MYSEAGFWNSEMATMKNTVKKQMLRPMQIIVPIVFTLTDFGKPCVDMDHFCVAKTHVATLMVWLEI